VLGHAKVGEQFNSDQVLHVDGTVVAKRGRKWGRNKDIEKYGGLQKGEKTMGEGGLRMIMNLYGRKGEGVTVALTFVPLILGKVCQEES